MQVESSKRGQNFRNSDPPRSGFYKNPKDTYMQKLGKVQKSIRTSGFGLKFDRKKRRKERRESWRERELPLKREGAKRDYMGEEECLRETKSGGF